MQFKIITLLSVITIFLFAVVNSSFLKNRYYTSFTYHLTDSEKFSSFLKNQHYFELYRSGIAIFKDYPFFGVGNKNYRIENRTMKQVNYFIIQTCLSFRYNPPEKPGEKYICQFCNKNCSNNDY